MDYETQRKLVAIFIMSVILVVIMAIIALVFIWLPDDEGEGQAFVVGKVNSQETSEDAIVKKYYKQIYVLFLNNDLDGICKLVGKDYLEYFKLDEQDIIGYLRDKSVLTKGLELVEYKSFILPGYSNVYEMDLKVKDKAYSINIVLRESSPNNYTIAFDKFVDHEADVYTFTKNSVKMDIEERIRYTNSVQYEIKLTNCYNKNIKINSGAGVNSIFLVNLQGEARKPIMTTLAATEITLEPNEFRTFTAVFNIEETFDYITYNTFVIKDSQFEGIQGADDLEFTLN